MRTLFTFLLTILLITGFVGCDGCGKDLPYVDINKMEVSVVQMKWINYGNSYTLQESTPVAYDSVFIYTSFRGKYYSNIKSNHSFSMLPSAIAGSDDCGIFDGINGSKETIESINIITITDFDNEFSSGDTINNIINVMKKDSDSIQSLNQFLTNIQPGINPLRINFTLARKPTEKVVQFRVAINLTNGEKYSGETIPITIKQ